MKTRNTLLALLLVLLVAACGDEVIPYKTVELKGKAVLEDPLSDLLGNTPAAEALVYLTETSQDVGKNEYLQTPLTADKNGRFVLTQQPDVPSKELSNYQLVIRYTTPDGLLYQRATPLSSLPNIDAIGEREFVLTPQFSAYKKGVLKVTVASPNSGNDRLAGATVLLFANATQAKSIAEKELSGVAYQSTTNLKGVAVFMAVNPGDYWLGAKFNGAYTVPAKVTIGVSTTAVEPLTMPTPVPVGGINITVVDSSGVALAGFKAYLFRNSTQLLTIDDNAVSGNIGEAKTTDLNGKVSFSPLDAGPYYIGVIGALPRRNKVIGMSAQIAVPTPLTVIDAPNIVVR